MRMMAVERAKLSYSAEWVSQTKRMHSGKMYNAVLLAAHGRGLAGYWRTPGVLRTAEGRAALGIPDDERFVALIHLGWPRQDKEPPERAPHADVVTYLR